MSLHSNISDLCGSMLRHVSMSLLLVSFSRPAEKIQDCGAHLHSPCHRRKARHPWQHGLDVPNQPSAASIVTPTTGGTSSPPSLFQRRFTPGSEPLFGIAHAEAPSSAAARFAPSASRMCSLSSCLWQQRTLSEGLLPKLVVGMSLGIREISPRLSSFQSRLSLVRRSRPRHWSSTDRWAFASSVRRTCLTI